jgi:hypothetical protein
MPNMMLRLSILLLVCVFAFLIVWLGRRFVETRRQRALAASAPSAIATVTHSEHSTAGIRILAFSSEDCRQCKQVQGPALRRVVEARGDAITIVDVDAPSSPELTQHYQVLTVPSTVILDATGKAHAINYGFANAQRLLEQVDAVLS